MKGLKENEIERIKDELQNCKRPIFLFHDDADGLCSFLLLYRFIKEGKGVIVKSRPSVDEKFVKNVTDYEADKVFILDC
jgi:single-stranded DNA-specific DHH superfamily exonuclease